MKKYKISVCTPTYNRENLLYGVFNSLKNQTFKDFEWIVVDDGSTDNTKEIIEKFKKEADFPVKYIYKSNGGKHTAVNKALDVANGEMFLIFDSDDECKDNALEKLWKYWDDIEKKDEFAGIAVLNIDKAHNIIGDKFPHDIFDSNFIDITFKYNVKGDRWIMVKTDIFKKFKFKEFKNEKYIAESSVWHQIGKYYKTRFINDPLLIVEYQNDGLSAKSVKLRKNSPCSAVYTYSNQMRLHIPFKYKLKAFLNCIRFGIYSLKCLFKCFRIKGK